MLFLQKKDGNVNTEAFLKILDKTDCKYYLLNNIKTLKCQTSDIENN